MQNEEEEDKWNVEPQVAIPRKGLLIAFIKRLYEQKNLQKICDEDYMIVPVSRFDDFRYDISMILQESINDLLE